MKYFKRNELLDILEKMKVLDIIMQSKEDDWLRLTNLCRLANANIYVLANGSGDELLVYFTDKGVYIKGFDHESKYNQYGADKFDKDFIEYIYKGAPTEFLNLLEEDAKNETTFCMWNLGDTDDWQENEIEVGNEDADDGGKEYLLSYICKDAEQWYDWATDYYEADLDMKIIEKIYAGEIVTEDDIRILNPERDVEGALEEIGEGE